MSELFDELRAAVGAEAPVALATVVEGPGIGGKLLVRPDHEPLGSLGDADLDRVVARDALGELSAGALTRVGKVLGYRVTVCDAREVFATKARFPFADEVVVDWPHRLLERVGPSLGPRDAVCVLTHDPKFDVPAVKAALATDVGYLGAMGSRRTTDDRNRRLRDEGVGDDQLVRVMAPIGIDIGARTPEETAVSILAEIIACRTGRRVSSLRDAEGSIH